MTDNISEKTKEEILSEYMSELGRKGGLKNKRKGPEYFKWVRSHRKDGSASSGEEPDSEPST